MHFNDIKSSFLNEGIITSELGSKFDDIKTIGSSYSPLTNDQLERDLFTCYAYGNKNSIVKLVELTWSRSLSDFDALASDNFKRLSSSLISSITSESFVLTSLNHDHQSKLGEFLVTVSEDLDREPKTLRVFISKGTELESGLHLRKLFLYPELYA